MDSNDNKESALFVLNVWRETLGGGRVEWRGEALHVDSGAVFAFEDWPDLVEVIADTLDTLSANECPLPLVFGKGAALDLEASGGNDSD